MKALFLIDDIIVEPLGIMWLSSYLKAADHEVDIVKTKSEDPVKKAKEFRPDMLCYSITTGMHEYYRRLNNAVREKLSWRPVSVFGGPHVTFFPEFTQLKGVDVGVRGEGFGAIVDLANADNGSEILSIPNTAVKGQVAPLRSLEPADEFLHPDRKLIYSYPENYHNPIKNVMASMGCPMNCSYCYNAGYRKLYGCNTLRVRPVEDIILEIEELRKFSLELIYFNDDVFPVYKPDWLFKFCKEYRKIHVPFHIQLRIELLAEDALKALKDAGLHGVTFAIESGDQCYRANTLNRHVTDEMILRGANMLHEYGIKFRAENMVGLPGETWDQSMKTLDLNIRCKPDIGWGAVYQPYPGTKLGDMCTRRGMFDGKVDRFSESFFERSVLSSPGMERFERLQKLFPLLVAHPSLRKIAKLLCQLPLDGMYRRLYTWYKKRLFLKRLYKT